MSGPSLADIEAATAAYTAVDLRTPNRFPSLVRARKLAYQAARYEGFSLSEIGRHFHKDHSTIHHACGVPVDDDDLLAVLELARKASTLRAAHA